MIDRGSPRALGRAVVGGHLLLLTGLVILFLTVRSGVILLATVLAVAAIVTGIRLHRIADRLPWLLLLLGLALLTVVNLDSFVRTTVLDQPYHGTSTFNELFQMGGYLGLLASALVVVLRHAPQDAGGVIDAALVGVGAAAPLWEFFLRPRMQANGASSQAQLVLLVEMLVLLATLGALLRISRTTRRGRGTLNYLFAALFVTLIGLVASAVLGGIRTPLQATLINLCWLVGYLNLAAAPLHPSAASLTEANNWRRDELSGVRLTQLGAVLLLIPVVGGVPQLFGRPPDGPLLVLGPMLTVPLVLTRIAQLMAQRTRDQRRLAHQASHDELTGLANRRHLFALASEATSRLRAGGLARLAVLYCDLDGFKPINDRLGHDAGDHALRVVGERLRASVRAGDVVGRIGGDEFVALCPDAALDHAAALRRRVEQAVAEPIAWHGEDMHLGVTIGVAVGSPTELHSADALIAAADQDMYTRKRARKAAQPPGQRTGHPEVDDVAHTVRS